MRDLMGEPNLAVDSIFLSGFPDVFAGARTVGDRLSVSPNKGNKDKGGHSALLTRKSAMSPFFVFWVRPDHNGFISVPQSSLLRFLDQNIAQVEHLAGPDGELPPDDTGPDGALAIGKPASRARNQGRERDSAVGVGRDRSFVVDRVDPIQVTFAGGRDGIGFVVRDWGL
jgi:hypothetical protein